MTRRMRFLAAGFAGLAACAAALVYTAAPAVGNLALHRPVHADSVYDPRYPPRQAVDGDHRSVTSRWLSSRTNNLDWSANPHWLEIDLGPCTVTGLRFWAGAEDEYKWPPVDFRLQGIRQGQWQDIVVETGNTKAVYARDFAPFVTDRVRLVATRGSDIGALRLYEVEILGYRDGG